MYSTLLLEIANHVATITFNRPEKRNAISSQMIADVLSALGEVEKGPAHVAILTGAGKAFCSGMDLEMLSAISTQSPEQNLEDSRRMASMFRRVWGFPKPLIAAVNGPALAGGCGIAMLCDFAIASEEAKFGYTEVRIGFIPALVSLFVRRQLGDKAARDLLLTGRIIEPAEAKTMGVVTEVVPAERLMARAHEIADTLLAASPTSLVRTKKLLRDSSAAEVDSDLQRAVAENASIRTTANFREGLAAFLEKRKPVWRHD
ncbi:MAG TPA: enoyl-CoA hydratase-related protein [Methylomirabilota bacterium]|nr:enoyl-CoA hydratase-related protein [Methylomirabilota bacterium]